MIRHGGSGPIAGDFRGKDIISLSQFCRPSLEKLFRATSKMRQIAINAKPSNILEGIIGILLFYEPSSRTCRSFEAALKQLGGAIWFSFKGWGRVCATLDQSKSL